MIFYRRVGAILASITLICAAILTGCPTDAGNPPDDTTYTVTFNTGTDGSVVPPQSVAPGGLVTHPTADPTRADHTFGGWYKDAAGTTPWDFDVDIVNTDISIYAKWIQIIKRTVTFDPQNGGAETTVQVNDGGDLTRPEVPVQTGYTFDGWYKDGAAWKFADETNPDPVTADITLTAKWTPLPGAADVSIIFPEDRAEDALPEDAITISKTGSKTSHTLEVSGTYAGYQWRVDGSSVGRGESFILEAGDFSVGPHRLTLEVTTAGGAVYSKSLSFTVEN
jgi:uncharacterized repeat protein (TIGR02543 family)